MTHVFAAGGGDVPPAWPGVPGTLSEERELALEWMRLASAHALGAREWCVIVLRPVSVSA